MSTLTNTNIDLAPNETAVWQHSGGPSCPYSPPSTALGTGGGSNIDRPAPSLTCPKILRTQPQLQVQVARDHLSANNPDTNLPPHPRQGHTAVVSPLRQQLLPQRGHERGDERGAGLIKIAHLESQYQLPLDEYPLGVSGKPPRLPRSDSDEMDLVLRLKAIPRRRSRLEYAVLAAAPWLCSVVMAALWSAVTGDIQTALQVVIYMFLANVGVLVVLAILDMLEDY